MKHKNSSKQIFIIGAGIGGLATGALLANRGFRVTILEKNNFIGGRASTYKEKGFTFDKGPSWYMMPEVFEKYFSQFNKKTSDYYKLIRLKENYKVFFETKNTYTIKADMKENIKLFNKTEKNGGAKLTEYLKQSKYLYNTSMKNMVYLDYDNPAQLLNIPLILNMPRLKLFSSFHSLVSKYFKNKELQKILEFTTVFLGGSPYNTPAFYSLVSHADLNLGIYYPEGGINKIIQALQELCREQGVNIKLNQEVTELKIENSKISKIFTKSDIFDADIVISNADYQFTETKLLPPLSQTHSDKYWSKKILSPSAFIVYLGINKKLKNISHHNLYFNSSWETHFEKVFKQRQWPENPSYYVHAPSLTDSGVCPKGSETLMFLVPIAPGLNDTDEIRYEFSKKILDHFESLISEKFTKNIVVKKIYSHRDFKKEYNSYLGTAFGIAHTLLQTGPFRPKNKSGKIKNLFYVGQYTNPGIGLPPSLISSQITGNLIFKKYGSE